MRIASITRKTSETSITLQLDIDGSGQCRIDSGIGFLDHMLQLFARHGRFDLSLCCEGDTYVDDHHSTEDIGIALGEAFRTALGDKAGINRYGSILLPMDEALVLCAVDLSGRSMLRFDLPLLSRKVGSFDTELVEEFFLAFTRTSGCCIHLKRLDGTNTHHIVEAAFKGFGRALRAAVSIDEALAGAIPSTKGTLS